MSKSKLEIAVKSLRSKKKLKWDNKYYLPGDLILHLAREVRKLRKTQCKPSVRCLFEYYNYIQGVYGSDSGDQDLLLPMILDEFTTNRD